MKLIKKNIKWISVIVIIILIISIVAFKFYLLKNEKVEIKTQNEEKIFKHELTTEEQLEEEIPELDFVFVDIKGAVVKPGVYEIESTKKVIDVVNLAGGFTEQADTSFINLAKTISNEMVIIIYTKEEVAKTKKEETITKIIDNECVCPQINNDACINKEETNNKNNSNTDTIKEKVNINSATLEELQTLTGIGESKAQAIIEYREKNGPFETIEELRDVSGIGEALYEKIKNNIEV